jgi:uncharacterized membrane protein YdbT with pleckstrin-like domain
MEEKTIWQSRPSQFVNFGVFLFWGLLFLLILTLVIYFWDSLHNLWSVLPFVGLLASMICLFYIALRWIITSSLKYTLTSERLLIESGVLSKRTQSLELYRVKDYTLVEPFLYRLVKLGSVSIVTSDPTTPKVEMRAITQPRPLLDTLRRQVETRRDAKRVREIDMDQIDDLSTGH